ncbi:type II toxin-antitoxin system VapC family toxin [Mesorhizobium sp. CAU 1741]|uniref:type II toxin-antitoxin system VapC family toxin n=1 Tax=Mesorhizobium sp. CAU 1741 TaxID=3140366 RepID=UPI00325C07C1
MYVDSSAIVAIVAAEDDGAELAASLGRSGDRVTSVVTQFEAAISLGRLHDDYEFGVSQVAEFVDKAEIKVLDIPADIFGDVAQAYRRYGRGTGHRAKLNFGDCFSYAFAKRLNMPLLFKGDDFSRTDIELG